MHAESAPQIRGLRVFLPTRGRAKFGAGSRLLRTTPNVTNQRLPAVAARLPGRPNPFRGVEKSCAFKFSFAKVFLKVQARAKRLSSQGRNQCLSMRNHDYLRVSGCGQNQSRKRRQQLRVQAGFRLIQNHQLGWTWCKQGCDPEAESVASHLTARLQKGDAANHAAEAAARSDRFGLPHQGGFREKRL